MDGTPQTTVALLAEGVDRNRSATWPFLLSRVALLAEGVDRNRKYQVPQYIKDASPSSQRAWIEMSLTRKEVSRSDGRPPRRGRG